MFVLFEHATGYAVFMVKEFEEISAFSIQVEKSIQDLSKFQSIVQLIAFLPFSSGKHSLENINCVSDGIVHEDLRNFLETTLPKSGKKGSIQLGVADAKLGTSIQEEFPDISILHTGSVPEIIRGIRKFFHHFIKNMSNENADKAQLGLGHAYSRAKVKFNVHRVDNMIIQSISLLDQLDKDINTFTMRVKEWYSYHFPELAKLVTDNYLYAKVVQVIGNRKTFDETAKREELNELLKDSGTLESILSAVKISMGMDISQIDLINIQRFTTRVVSLADYRKSLQSYLVSRMHSVAPNLATLIGEQVGARLISHAGSLTNLAKYPASTVQILGAEKALFRALKTRGNTPKYGLIFHSTFIGRAGSQNKGRISRYLANKCSLASRIDCFAEYPTTIYGNYLRQQVEDRLTFYESGEIPEKNVEVMHKASVEAITAGEIIRKKERKRAKKAAKRKAAELATSDSTTLEDISSAIQPPEKKIAKRTTIVNNESAVMESANVETPKLSKEERKKMKKLKRKLAAAEETTAAKAVGSGDASDSFISSSEKTTATQPTVASPKSAVNLDATDLSQLSKKERKKLKKKMKKLAAASAVNSDETSSITNHSSVATEFSSEKDVSQVLKDGDMTATEIVVEKKKKKKKHASSSELDGKNGEMVDTTVENISSTIMTPESNILKKSQLKMTAVSENVMIEKSKKKKKKKRKLSVG